MIQITNSSFLYSTAQVYVMPINSHAKTTSTLLDKFNSMYPRNFERYRRVSVDGRLRVGSTLLVRSHSTSLGLSPPTNGVRPDYIANLVYTGHPLHTARVSWLESALDDLITQLEDLVNFEGVKKLALYAPPLLDVQQNTYSHRASDEQDADMLTRKQVFEMIVLPMLQEKFATYAELTVDIHVNLDDEGI